jgi:type IV pilus assembly protein PilX
MKSNIRQMLASIRDPLVCIRRAERGVSLVIVLVALLLMSIAAVGLVRMVDTGSLVLGNLAFKQGATSAADRGAERAITYIQPKLSGTTLYNDATADGYYATSLSALDITGKSTTTSRAVVDWDGDSCAYAASGTYSACLAASLSEGVNGYESKFVIARMCKTTGDPNSGTNDCAKPVSTTGPAAPKRGELKYGDDKRFEGTSGPYFRIVVRAKGPRNTISYTETYVHF